eukprot:13491203-Alexandrium_andersonii.AAC.1
MLRADHESAWARRNAFAGAYKERKQQEHQAAVKALTARKDAQISALMDELERARAGGDAGLQQQKQQQQELDHL